MRYTQDRPSEQVGQVFVEFTDKPVSAWAGMATLIGSLLEQIQFRSWVEDSLPIREISNNSCGEYSKILTHLLTVFSGGERFAHMQWWCHGVEVFEQAFCVERFAKSSTSLTRFWNKFDSFSKSEAWSEHARDFVRQILAWSEITSGNLNMDSTVLTRYGKQEGANKGYNPRKKGRPSHHPLLAFVDSGHVVNLWNRPGDTSSGQNCHSFFEQTVQSLGDDFIVKYVLCDSGFYRAKFVEYLEHKGYSYILAVPIISAIQGEIKRVTKWKTIEDGLEVGEFNFEHKDEKWTKPRRYVVVRQHVETRPNAVGKSGKQMVLFGEDEVLGSYRYSVMITSDKALEPVEVWRNYRPRANDENVFKDLKEGLGFGAFNLQSFWATEAVMTTTALVAYNLLRYLDTQLLNRNKPSKRSKTIRQTWFILPGQLGSSGRKYRLRIAVKTKNIRAKIRRILNEIVRIPHQLNCDAVKPP